WRSPHDAPLSSARGADRHDIDHFGARTSTGWRADDRLRSFQLRSERAPSRALTGADQQPDHQPAEPGEDAAEPGQEPDEPSILLPADHRAVDRQNPATAQSGSTHRLRHPPDRSELPADLSSGLCGFDLIAAAPQRYAGALAECARRLS